MHRPDGLSPKPNFYSAVGEHSAQNTHQHFNSYLLIPNPILFCIQAPDVDALQTEGLELDIVQQMMGLALSEQADPKDPNSATKAADLFEVGCTSVKVCAQSSVMPYLASIQCLLDCYSVPWVINARQ